MPPIQVQDAPGLAGIGAVPATVPGPITGAPGASVQSNVLLWYVDQATGKVALGPGPLAAASAPSPSAALDMQSTTGGFLMPRLTTVQRNAIPGPLATALLLYNTTTGQYEAWDGSAWASLAALSGGWAITGNALTDTGLLGALTAQDVHVITTNTRRMTILSTGQIAVGPADPDVADAFDVADNTGSFALAIPLTGNAVARWRRDQASELRMEITNTNFGAAASARLRFTEDSRAYSIGVTSSGAAIANAFELRDETAGANRVVVDAAGAVAIGPAAPTAGNLFEVQNAPDPLPFQLSSAGSPLATLRRDDAGTIAVILSNQNAGALARAEYDVVCVGHLWGMGAYGAAAAIPSAFSIVDNTAALDRFIIDANGRVAIGISAPDPSAKLDIQGTDGGLLLPRMTGAQYLALNGGAPAHGIAAFVTDEDTTGQAVINVGTPANPAKAVVGSQHGTTTLVNGQSPFIPAHVSATSSIIGFIKNMVPGAGNLTEEYGALAADRVVGEAGAGGGFKITALLNTGLINVVDLSTLDYIIVG